MRRDPLNPYRASNNRTLPRLRSGVLRLLPMRDRGTRRPRRHFTEMEARALGDARRARRQVMAAEILTSKPIGGGTSWAARLSV